MSRTDPRPLQLGHIQRDLIDSMVRAGRPVSMEWLTADIGRDGATDRHERKYPRRALRVLGWRGLAVCRDGLWSATALGVAALRQSVAAGRMPGVVGVRS